MRAPAAAPAASKKRPREAAPAAPVAPATPLEELAALVLRLTGAQQDFLKEKRALNRGMKAPAAPADVSEKELKGQGFSNEDIAILFNAACIAE